MYNGYKNAKITGNFGEKRSYYKPGKSHEGVDIALAMNSPINSLLAGTVLSIKNDPNGYGNYVDIDHGNGVVTRYGHANSFNVKKGQKVKEGEQIGLVGSTGRSSGPHLHVEYLLNGIKKNPMELEKDMANMLKPKGTLGTQDAKAIESLANEIALGQTPQGGNPVYQISPEEQRLREQTIANVLGRLEAPVEMPRYTTIQDIFNAEKGDRLGTIAEFLNNPETMRTIGNFLPKYGYNPRTGRIRNVMEEPARRQEAQMQAEQEKAIEAQKQQNNLAKSIYGYFLTQDIENMRDARARELAENQMKWNTEQKELDRKLEDKKLGITENHYKAMEDIQIMKDILQRDILAQDADQFEKELALKEKSLAANRAEKAADRASALERVKLMRKELGIIPATAKSATGGAAGVGGTNLNNIKMVAADRKALTENKTTLANIDAGLKSLEKNKDAYSLWKGLLGSDITNRIDPKGVATRTQIDNITAVYRKWLTGAQMSDKERKAYERFLPAPTDNYNIVKSKLEGMRGAVQRSNDAILSNYGINSSGNADPLGLGL